MKNKNKKKKQRQTKQKPGQTNQAYFVHSLRVTAKFLLICVNRGGKGCASLARINYLYY